MRFPSKVTSYDESLFPHLILLERELKNCKTISIIELYSRNKKSFQDVDEYLSILDILFAIGKIKLNLETKGIQHVD